MKVTETKDSIIIEIPKNAKPVLSSTGKTLQVASSHGNTPTNLIVDGQPLTVGVNAYIKNSAYVKPTG